jgi:hypothetical protein
MICALMYCEADLPESMELARLLADVEPVFQHDFRLALVSQPGTPRPALVDRTVGHCERRFEVDVVTSPLGAAGWPVGCTALWFGTCLHYHDLYTRGLLGPHRSIVTLDANDGAPLHKNWISLLRELHARARTCGKTVVGAPYYIDRCPLHMNSNALFDFDFFAETHVLDDVPRYDGTQYTHYDIYHASTMLPHALLSSAVRTDWHGAGDKATPELLAERSREAVWLHGYKDADFRWRIREHLERDLPQPTLSFYDLDRLRRHETTQRQYEEVSW